MNIILREFKISKEENRQRVIYVLKFMVEEANKRLLASNNVGEVLKLKK